MDLDLGYSYESAALVYVCSWERERKMQCKDNLVTKLRSACVCVCTHHNPKLLRLRQTRIIIFILGQGVELLLLR